MHFGVTEVVVDLVKPGSDWKCAEGPEGAAEGHLAFQGEVVEPDLYLKHVEGVEEGHLAKDPERQEEGVDPRFEVTPVEGVEGVAEGHLTMHSERQGEDVEGVEEGHLAIDSER
jgi:hypothetical protein